MTWRPIFAAALAIATTAPAEARAPTILSGEEMRAAYDAASFTEKGCSDADGIVECADPREFSEAECRQRGRRLDCRFTYSASPLPPSGPWRRAILAPGPAEGPRWVLEKWLKP